MQLTLQFIKRVLPNAVIAYDTFAKEFFYSVDTRTIQAGDLFVALPGTNVDGHEFVVQAFDRGAAGCIIEKTKQSVLESVDKKVLKNSLVILVDDTYKALISLAHAWRMQFEYPVIAITGSVGKTSVKELVAHILRSHELSYLASPGNANTITSIAVNILRMREHHAVLIQEVGIEKPGEMDVVVQMLQPTNGIITNIGHQHMDGLGSLADIAIEKRKLFSKFTEKNIGIINGDQTLLSDVAYRHPVIRFGSKTINQIQARKIQISGSHTNFILKIYKNKYPVSLKQSHEGVVFNVLASAAVAYFLGVPDAVILKAVQKLITVEGRFEQCTIADKKGIMINDAYNANPESMKSALLAFQHIETNSPKIAVIGDMLGLGVNSPFWHRQIGRFLRKVPSLHQVILVGNLVSWTKKTAPVGLAVSLVDTWQEAIAIVQEELASTPLILVKGSQAIGLHHLVDTFVEK